jgi:hypothetical protein
VNKRDGGREKLRKRGRKREGERASEKKERERVLVCPGLSQCSVLLLKMKQRYRRNA